MYQCLTATRTGCRREFPRRLLHRLAALTISTLAVAFPQTPDTNAFSAESATRPNVVLIMADDMGYECIQANGSLDYKTPNIDALAAAGLRFEHCYAQPICTPSRVKLMTGKSNKRNYVRFGTLDRKQTTFAHLLKHAGYKTCIAGKWQLGNEVDAPQHFGFDQALLWQHTRGRNDKQKHDTRYPNPRLELNGKPLDYNDGEFSSDLFVDFLGDFIETNREEPFFVYYPMALVHCPFSPTPDSDDWNPRDHGSRNYKGTPKYFADMVAYVDKTIGKLDARLKQLGVRDNTLLMFVGDNGTDTPIVTNTTFGKVAGAKGQMIDAGNHVPCVISWPGVIREGRVVKDIIDFSDFLPTICEATGAEIPADLTIDGQSFLPQLKGETGSPRDSIYMWYSRNGGVKEARAFARNQRYKLYESGKFFDISNDRDEQKPLSDDSLSDEQRQVKAVLKARLDRFDKIVPVNAR
ncbi:MAG: sulfatase-like hydrolase/transferase [Rhodopirellula sp.]|nr:sulfatase-like hydrolase/transferase [Rhodopirellula sp.]